MKDGVYSVRLTIDGQVVLARGEVRDGVFRGLGEFAGIVGVVSTNGMRNNAPTRNLALPDTGVTGDTAWSRVPLDRGESANDVACHPALLDRLRLISTELARIGPVIREVAARSAEERAGAIRARARLQELRRDADDLIAHFDTVRNSLPSVTYARLPARNASAC